LAGLTAGWWAARWLPSLMSASTPARAHEPKAKRPSPGEGLGRAVKNRLSLLVDLTATAQKLLGAKRVRVLADVDSVDGRTIDVRRDPVGAAARLCTIPG